MVALLKEFRDSFAWDYDEMPGLDRKLIEHRLPIKEGFKPYKQPPIRMAPDIIPAGIILCQCVHNLLDNAEGFRIVLAWDTIPLFNSCNR